LIAGSWYVLNVRIAPDLKARVKVALQRRTLAEVIRELVECWVDEDPEELEEIRARRRGKRKSERWGDGTAPPLLHVNGQIDCQLRSG